MKLLHTPFSGRSSQPRKGWQVEKLNPGAARIQNVDIRFEMPYNDDRLICSALGLNKTQYAGRRKEIKVVERKRDC